MRFALGWNFKKNIDGGTWEFEVVKFQQYFTLGMVQYVVEYTGSWNGNEKEGNLLNTDKKQECW